MKDNAFEELLGPGSATASTPTKTKPRLSPRLRKLLGLTVLASIVAGGVFVFTTLRAEDRAPVTYRTAPIEKGDVVKTVTATGTLSPRVTVTVGAQVSGRVQDLYVDFNSRVKKGQVIARIDPRMLNAEVSKAKANLASARARLTQARAKSREAKLQYDRDLALAKKNVVAAAEVESRRAASLSANAEVTAANAGVAQANAALEVARTNLGYATIISPIDGVVVSRSVDVGQTVAASLSAPTLFTIAQDLKKMEVHTSVAESDVGQLKDGQKAELSVDAHPGKIFEGVVKQVRYEAQTVQNVVTYDAVISVPNDALALRPGMTANVTFIVAKREGVLRVANAATRWRPERSGAKKARKPRTPGQGKAKAKRPEGQKRIFVLRDGKPRPVLVKLGLADSTSTELTQAGELKAGDLLIVGVQSGGAAGAKAKPAGKQASKGGRGPRRIF